MKYENISEMTKENAVNKRSTFLVITREYIISLLRAWQKNEITTADFYLTVEQLYHIDDAKYLDEEGEEEHLTNSATSEMLGYLEMLDMDFITQEDVNPAIEFLQTKVGNFEEGMRKWEKYRHSINHEERIIRLNGQYPYIYDERYDKK